VDLLGLADLQPADAVIVAVRHAAFVAGGWPFICSLLKGRSGPVLDVKGLLARSEAPDGVDLWRL
jgi:UDP-N-acetyl-D-galactosamine dehydrogenase